MVGLSSSASSSKPSSLSDKVHEALHSDSFLLLGWTKISLVNTMFNETITSASVWLSNNVYTLGMQRVQNRAELQISAGFLGL
jgi:hypothetical protein